MFHIFAILKKCKNDEEKYDLDIDHHNGADICRPFVYAVRIYGGDGEDARTALLGRRETQPLLFVDGLGEKRDKKLSRGRIADGGARNV